MIQDGLNALAFEDDLTGLPNRRHLLKYLADNIPWSKGDAPPASLILFGFDAFRKVNDGLGQAEGDQVLVQFADRLKGAFRPGDVAVRLRGDVFAAVLPGIDRSRAIEQADRIRSGLQANPLRGLDRSPVAVTLSAGISTFPGDGSDAETLIDAADRALFHSKKLGGNRTSACGQLDDAIVAERDRFGGLPCRAYTGRRSELDAARRMIAGLKARESGILVVQGPAGSGKSRFLRELVREANQAQVLFLHTLCTEANRMSVGSSLSYITNRYYERHLQAADTLRSRLRPAQRAIARQLLPSLARWQPEGIEPAARDRKILTLQVLETAVVTMAELMPTLILLDNVQNVDRATFDILKVILRDRKAPIGVVFALRKDIASLDRSKEPLLVEFVDQFLKDPRWSLAQMGPLSAEDQVAMIDSILGNAPRPPGFDDLLTQRAQGSPAYLEETLRGLILRDKIIREGAGYRYASLNPDTDLPANLDAAIQAVLAHLPPETSELLTNAAIVGTKFDVQMLQEVMGTREAQTLAAVEKAKTTRIIRVSDDGSIDQLEFSSESTRDLRYSTTPEEKKRETHRRIATVGNARNRPAAEVSFHNNQAAGINPSITDETAEFVPGAPPIRVPRVPEGKTPLGVEDIRRLMAVLRAFSGLLKVGRLYPQWSTTAAQFKNQLVQSLGDLLSGAATVTLTADAGGMKANGQDIDTTRGGESVIEFTALMGDRLMSGMTFQQGLDAAEIEALVKALTDPLKSSQAPADHWDRFLDREAIRHVDILQRRYVSREGDSMRILRREIPVERPLQPEEIESLSKALRYLKAASDNLKLYPPGHSAVEESIESAANEFTDLVSRLRLLSLAVVDQNLVVNGMALQLGDAGAWIHSEIKTRELKSLTLVDNLRKDEIQALVSILSIPGNDPKAAAQAEAVLAGNEIRHFTFGARMYSKVETGTKQEAEEAPVSESTPAESAPAPAPAAEKPVEEPSRDVRADLRARLYLKMNGEQVLTDAFEKEFVPLIESLNFGWSQYLAAQLINHVAYFTLIKVPALRIRALQVLARGFREFKEDSRVLLMNTAKPSLEEHIERETDEEVLATSVEVVRCWLDLALSFAKLREVAEFLARITTVKMDAVSTLHQYRTGIMSRLTSLGTPDRIALFLKSLSSENPSVRESASMILGALGAPMIPHLIRFIRDTADSNARIAAASAIHAIGGNGQPDLGRALTEESTPEEAVRILQVLERAGSGPLATPILAALHHKNPDIREAGWDLIQRIREKAVVAAILRRLLSGEKEEIQKRTLVVASRMTLPDLAPDVKRLLLAVEDDAMARLACEYFKSTPNAGAVPALRRIFETKPRMFGIVKGFSDDTRAMAVSAARAAPCRDTTQLLEDARKDSSKAVRQAAN